MAQHGKPFYKAFPSNFLGGMKGLTAEERGVYRTLLDLMYDKWQPIPWGSLSSRQLIKQRRDLAAECGCSVRAFSIILDRLLVLVKVEITSTGDLSNARFARESARLNDELGTKNGEITSAITSSRSNKNKGLHGDSRARESRLHIPDSTVQGSGEIQGTLSPEAHKVIESEITQICRAIGVDLRSSTHRFAWPARWVEMRDKHRLTLEDMLGAINSYSGQFRGESVKSLGLYQDRAIEKRTARELSYRIAGHTHAREEHEAATTTRDQWSERLRMFIELGTWSPAYGPSPLDPGCVVPHDMLEKAEGYWISNGNHPKAMHHGGTRVAWAPGKAGSVRTATPFAPRSSRAAPK